MRAQGLERIPNLRDSNKAYPIRILRYTVVRFVPVTSALEIIQSLAYSCKHTLEHML